MKKLLYIGTFATDDPTRATLPFIAASGALDRKHEPMIVFMGEAVYLLKTEIINAIQGVGFPPVKQLMKKMIEHKVPLYV
jgi:predicted peroxiredoxin